MADNNTGSVDVRALVRYFALQYSQAFEAVYLPQWGRDGKLMKDLIKSLLEVGEENPQVKVEEAIRYFVSDDNAFKGSCDIPAFYKAFNRIQVSIAKIKKWDKL